MKKFAITTKIDRRRKGFNQVTHIRGEYGFWANIAIYSFQKDHVCSSYSCTSTEECYCCGKDLKTNDLAVNWNEDLFHLKCYKKIVARFQQSLESLNPIALLEHEEA